MHGQENIKTSVLSIRSQFDWTNKYFQIFV